jgi:hypothetical protein
MARSRNRHLEMAHKGVGQVNATPFSTVAMILNFLALATAPGFADGLETIQPVRGTQRHPSLLGDML